MKDLRDLKDLTIHDVQPISDESTQAFSEPGRFFFYTRHVFFVPGRRLHWASFVPENGVYQVNFPQHPQFN